MKPNNKSWLYIAIAVSCSLTAIITTLILVTRPRVDIAPVVGGKIFTSEDLKKYDGSSSERPIYIAMNGLVYDVSAGKEYYLVGGPYHYLAGKDSSKELNLFGGAIIKRKYPVIGKLN